MYPLLKDSSYAAENLANDIRMCYIVDINKEQPPTRG